jgi:REP element-mobilizing transposase RayT
VARALRIEFEGALYHVCARGNRRQRIFGGEKDQAGFLHLLGESVERFAIELHGYVLLPNHFHLLVRTRRANLSRWMHWLLVGYSVRFNLRHHTSGHLFQGRYKSFLVEAGPHLLELSRYIHLNPVRGQVIGAGNPSQRRERLRAYRWSSYRGYAGLAKQDEFVSEQLVLGELDQRRRVSAKERRTGYRRFVEEGLLREVANPFEAVRWQTVLGSETFAQKIRDKMGGASRREVRAVRATNKDRMNPQEVLKSVAKHYGMSIDQLLGKPSYGSEAHNVAMWVLWGHGEFSLREIGMLFGGIDYVAVSQRIRRTRERAKKDKKLNRFIKC